MGGFGRNNAQTNGYHRKGKSLRQRHQQTSGHSIRHTGCSVSSDGAIGGSEKKTAETRQSTENLARTGKTGEEHQHQHSASSASQVTPAPGLKAHERDGNHGPGRDPKCGEC